MSSTNYFGQFSSFIKFEFAHRSLPFLPFHRVIVFEIPQSYATEEMFSLSLCQTNWWTRRRVKSLCNVFFSVSQSHRRFNMLRRHDTRTTTRKKSFTTSNQINGLRRVWEFQLIIQTEPEKQIWQCKALFLISRLNNGQRLCCARGRDNTQPFIPRRNCNSKLYVRCNLVYYNKFRQGGDERQLTKLFLKKPKMCKRER